MVRFIDNLYVSESVKPRISSIKWKTVCGIGMVSIYFITLSSNGKDLFDIFSSLKIKQRRFRRSKSIVIGIAGDYSEAVDLVKRMVEDYYSYRTDSENARQYYERYIENNLS